MTRILRRPARSALLAVAVLAVAALALLPGSAGAQTPPATFDENGVLTTPTGTVR